MKISTKGRYGVKIMLDIAQNGTDSPVKISDISARQNISTKYTEQITGNLARSGLVRSVRGAQGGYVLAKKASDYTVGEILRKTEGDLAPELSANYERDIRLGRGRYPHRRKSACDNACVY